MQINIQGIATKEKMLSNLEGLIADLTKRIGIPEGTKIHLDDLQVKVSFQIGDTIQYATVKRNVGDEEISEIFQVAVRVNEDGEIAIQEDNENESFYDGYTLAQSVGAEYEYEGIESAYKNEDLEIISFIEDNESEDKKVVAARYKIKDEEGKILIRYYKGEKLVAEKIVIETEEI